MKTPIYVDEMILAFFAVVEKHYLSSNKFISTDKHPFFNYEEGLTHMIIREYYHDGLRFLIFLTPDEIYLYLRAEYIGGYIPKRPLSANMPKINGFVPFFSEKKVLFRDCTNYETILNPVFEHMEKIEYGKNYAMNTSLILTDKRKKFKTIFSSVLETANNFFGTLLRESEARNPFTMKQMKVEDGVWFTRTYASVTLLFGMRDSKLYIFCDHKTMDSYEAPFGVQEKPPHLYVWTMIYIGDLKEEKYIRFTDDASFNLLDFSAKLLVKTKKEEEDYILSLSDN